VLSLSLTKRREIEHLRDVIFRGVGTDEPLIEQDLMEMAGELGIPHWQIVTRQWRKPLSIPEISRMAPTPEVRERRGRP
jgi:predicted urease superfamily metal-dependent hydrolase